MKKRDISELNDELRAEYVPEDFAGRRAERGKFAKLLRRKSNVVRIAPDLHDAFPNERAVNAALRTLLDKRPKRPTKARRAAKRASR